MGNESDNKISLPDVKEQLSTSNSIEDNESATEHNQSNFVTEKDFPEFRAETIQQIEDKTSLFGINTGNVLIGSVVVELLLFVILFICFKDNMGRLSKRLTKQSEKIEDLTRKIERLERNTAQQKNSAPIVNFSAPPKPISEIQSFSEQRPTERQVVTEPRPIAPEEKYKSFVKDFNALVVQSGFNLKTSRNEFMKKYRIQMFTCTNFEARMNEPVPNPIFDSDNSLPNPDYWAYEFEPGVFAVVPNVKTYSDNHHTARAMGVVFNSNFTAGRTYNKIRVNKPAIFKGMWNFERQGELELS